MTTITIKLNNAETNSIEMLDLVKSYSAYHIFEFIIKAPKHQYNNLRATIDEETKKVIVDIIERPSRGITVSTMKVIGTVAE
jgi:hypothetical protein